MKKTVEESRIDVLLTYPKDGLRLFQSMIPIGLVSIGTVLQRSGYRVAIIDFNHYQNDFRRQLQFLRPRIIGIGGTTPSRQGSFYTACLSKQVLPDTVVVYGGINATFIAQTVLEGIKDIDYVIKGEAELSFLSLCDAIIKSNPDSIDSIPGLCYRNGMSIVENKLQRIHDLSVLPIPNRDLVGNHYDLEMEFIGGSGDYIITSRGCPAACNFCSASSMFPGGVRLRPINSVMNEIDYLLSRRKLSGIKIFDSTFTANREHVENFCKHVKEMKTQWECEIRADTVDRDLLRIMRESGCYYINMGMETSNLSQLKHISKGITPKQVLDVLAICNDIGIRSKVFFTFGHIGQTFKECLEDIEFIDHNRDEIDFFGVTAGMRIYPGTRLEKECRRKGIIKADFSWIKSARKFGNYLVFEPGDVPVLFQKNLGSLKLMIILFILFRKKLLCTKRFLFRMLLENISQIIGNVRLTCNYTRQRMERKMGMDLNDNAWDGTSYNCSNSDMPGLIK